MAYNPTNWVNGDVITAEKLNKVEEALDALGKNVPRLVFHVTKTVTYDEQEQETVTYDSDKTFEEVYTAVEEYNESGSVLMVLKTVEQYYGEEPYTETKYLTSVYAEDESSIRFYEEDISFNDMYIDIGLSLINSFVGVWQYTSDGAVVEGEGMTTTASATIQYSVSKESNTYTFPVSAKHMHMVWEAGINLRLSVGSLYGEILHNGTVVGVSYTAGMQNTDYVFQVLDPVLGLVNFTAATETDNPTYTKTN